MTVRDLITRSLRLAGIIGGNETPSANEASDALSSLNDMVDDWSTQQLLIVAKVQETFPLVASQQSYQMGVGAPDFNTARPQKIENAIFQQNPTDPRFNLPIEIITQDEFAYLSVPLTQSTIPKKLFVNYTFPYATLYFYYVPSIVNNVILWSWKPLTSFASLDTVVLFPPGYAKALRYCLAVELAPEYGKTLDQVIIEQALMSIANIKRMNIKPLRMKTDTALLGRNKPFNWRTGE